MLEFYIKENGSFTKQDIIIPATLNTTFDETLDSAEVILKANDIETPYIADTKCQFRENGNVISNMIIVSDDVSRLSHGLEKYRHTLHLAQNTRLLQKHLVRNSSFSQPRDKYKRSWTTYGSEQLKDFVREEIELLYTEKPIVYDTNKCDLKIKLGMELSKRNDYPSSTPIKKFSQCKYVNGTYTDGHNNTRLSWTNFLDTDDVNIKVSLYYRSNGVQTVVEIPHIYKANVDLINTDLVIPLTIDTTKELYQVKVSVITPSTTQIVIGGETINCNKNYVACIDENATSLVVSSFSIASEIEIYTYTMYDVLLILRNQYFLDNDRYSTTDNDKVAILYDLPSSSDTFGKILRNTIAPNFTFTGATFYECLSEIFKYYDATFTLSENNLLGIEYLNEYNRAKIEATFSNRMSTFSEENFTTGYVSYFENGLIEESFSCGARNETLGIAQNDNWAFIMPHTIQSISKAEIYVEPFNYYANYHTDGRYNFFANGGWFDITNFIYSQDIYSSLSSQQQRGYIYYSGNSIHIGGVNDQYGFTETLLSLFMDKVFDRYYINSYGDVAFIVDTDSPSINRTFQKAKIRITYVARVDGRTRIENEENKYKGETIVNQANGAVDLNKMGLNMLGLSYKLGQPTLGMTQSITNWNDRVIKGQIYEYNGERWLANVVKYQFYNDHITANIDFIKNYNALAQRIQVDRQKRLSQISNELAVKSEDNYCEYMYISSEQLSINADILGINNSLLLISELEVFNKNHNLGHYTIDYATITPYLQPIGQATRVINRYDRKDSTTKQINYVYTPTAKYSSGNALCLEMSFNHPLTSGNRTYFTDTENSGYSENGLYTDNGWADTIDINFSQNNGIFDDNFPYVGSQLLSRGSILKLKYFKKPNEIFALNYELIHLVPTERQGIDFIGNALIKSNGMLEKGNINLKLYYSTTEIYSPFDLKGINTDGDILNITSVSSSQTTGNNDFAIIFRFSTITQNTKSWAICDTDGNILFSSNTNIYNQNRRTLYFYPKHTRL